MLSLVLLGKETLSEEIVEELIIQFDNIEENNMDRLTNLKSQVLSLLALLKKFESKLVQNNQISIKQYFHSIHIQNEDEALNLIERFPDSILGSHYVSVMCSLHELLYRVQQSIKNCLSTTQQFNAYDNCWNENDDNEEHESKISEIQITIPRLTFLPTSDYNEELLRPTTTNRITNSNLVAHHSEKKVKQVKKILTRQGFTFAESIAGDIQYVVISVSNPDFVNLKCFSHPWKINTENVANQESKDVTFQLNGEWENNNEKFVALIPLTSNIRSIILDRISILPPENIPIFFSGAHSTNFSFCLVRLKKQNDQYVGNNVLKNTNFYFELSNPYLSIRLYGLEITNAEPLFLSAEEKHLLQKRKEASELIFRFAQIFPSMQKLSIMNKFYGHKIWHFLSQVQMEKISKRQARSVIENFFYNLKSRKEQQRTILQRKMYIFLSILNTKKQIEKIKIKFLNKSDDTEEKVALNYHSSSSTKFTQFTIKIFNFLKNCSKKMNTFPLEYNMEDPLKKILTTNGFSSKNLVNLEQQLGLRKLSDLGLLSQNAQLDEKFHEVGFKSLYIKRLQRIITDYNSQNQTPEESDYHLHSLIELSEITQIPYKKLFPLCTVKDLNDNIDKIRINLSNVSLLFVDLLRLDKILKVIHKKQIDNLLSDECNIPQNVAKTLIQDGFDQTLDLFMLNEQVLSNAGLPNEQIQETLDRIGQIQKKYAQIIPKINKNMTVKNVLSAFYLSNITIPPHKNSEFDPNQRFLVLYWADSEKISELQNNKFLRLRFEYIRKCILFSLDDAIDDAILLLPKYESEFNMLKKMGCISIGHFLMCEKEDLIDLEFVHLKLVKGRISLIYGNPIGKLAANVVPKITKDTSIQEILKLVYLDFIGPSSFEHDIPYFGDLIQIVEMENFKKYFPNEKRREFLTKLVVEFQKHSEQNHDEQKYDEQKYGEQKYDEQKYDEQKHDEQKHDQIRVVKKQDIDYSTFLNLTNVEEFLSAINLIHISGFLHSLGIEVCGDLLQSEDSEFENSNISAKDLNLFLDFLHHFQNYRKKESTY